MVVSQIAAFFLQMGIQKYPKLFACLEMRCNSDHDSN